MTFDHGLDKRSCSWHTYGVNGQCLSPMTQPTAFSTYDWKESTLASKVNPHVDPDLATFLLVQAHPDLSITIQGDHLAAGSAVLQILKEIDDNTLCHIAEIVAEHSKQVTDPAKFAETHKCLAAAEALACVIGGMGIG
jgi:hypothetical protein